MLFSHRIDEKRLKEIEKEALKRIELASSVNVSSAYQTLFYGLRRNHEHNMAVIHPISFVLRRVIFAIAIMHM